MARIHNQVVIERNLNKTELLAQGLIQKTEEARLAKQSLLTDKETLNELYEYVFGNGENPLAGLQNEQEATEEYFIQRCDELIHEAATSRK